MSLIDADWPPCFSNGEGCPDLDQSPNAILSLAITCTRHPRMTSTGPNALTSPLQGLDCYHNTVTVSVAPWATLVIL